MAKYKFQLETLEKIRRARRDELRAALAEAFQAEHRLAESRADLAAETEQLRSLQRTATAGPYTNVNLLLDAQRYELLLKSRSEELAKRAILLAAETKRRRQALVESDRDVRVLERLDERKQDEFNRDAQRRETKQLDEVAATCWLLRQEAAR